MGLFSRKDKVITIQNEGDAGVQEPTVNTDNYLFPMGLSFDVGRILSADNNALSTFYACIELIANSIASTPIIIKDRETLKPIKDHELLNVFNSPNLSKFLLIKQLISDAYRWGNGFAYIKRDGTGHPVQLIYRPAGSVSINYNPMTQKLYYLDPIISSRKIEPVNMIHIRKDSKDGINGISISKIGSKIFDLAKSTDSTAKDFFDSGCNVSGVLTSEKYLSPKQKQEILADWHSAFNSGKSNTVGVLGFDMKYQPVASNANDSQLLQSREFNCLEICRYFQISPLLVGVQKGGSAYGTLESAQLDLIIHTLMPWICLLEEEFNNKLVVPSERESIYIDFDEDKINFASKTDTANYYTNLVKNGILTINEARVALGYGEKEGLDDNFIPYTDISQNTIGGDKKDEESQDDKEDEQ